MKKLFLPLFYLLSIILLIYSCNKDVLETQENLELSKFKNSSDFSSFSKNFPDLVNNIDYSSYTEVEERGTKLHGLNIINDGKKIGSLTFIPKKDNSYITIIEVFEYNEQSNLIGINCKNVYNETAISFNAKENSDGTYSLKLKKSPKEYSFSKRGWWSCWTDCISDALSICFGDFGCGSTCVIMLAMCPDSISTACGVWCIQDSNNDLIPDA